MMLLGFHQTLVSAKVVVSGFVKLTCSMLLFDGQVDSDSAVYLYPHELTLGH